MCKNLVALSLVAVIFTLMGCRANIEATTVAPSPTVEQLIVVDGLVAYYPFDGNADDKSGNGHDGAAKGVRLAQDRLGRTGQTYELDGVDDYIELGNDIIRQDVFAFSIWFKTDHDKSAQTIVGNYIPCSYSHTGFILLCYGSMDDKGNVGKNKPSLLLTNQGTDASISYPANMIDNKWHHVVGGYDASEYYLYVDDVLVGRKNASYVSTSESIKIGMGGSRCGNNNFKGWIDDLRIYNRVLDESEVRLLYDEGSWSGD